MLKKKLMLTYSVLIILVVVILGITTTRITTTSIDSQMKEIYAQEFNIGLRELENKFSKYKSQALNICIDTNLQIKLRNIDVDKNIHKDLSNYRISGTEITIYPMKNEVMYSYDEETKSYYPNEKLVGEGWVKKTLNKDGSFAWFSNIEGSPNKLRFSKSIIDNNDWESVIGIISIDINLNYINQILSEIHLGESGRIYLINNLYEGILPYFVDSDEFEMLFEKENLFIDKQEKAYTLVKPVIEMGGYLIGVIPINQIIAAGNEIQVIFCVVGVTAIIISLIIAYIFSKQISDPIMKLADTMSKVESGDLDITIKEPKGNGEIKILYKQFNYMINMINDLIEEVYVRKIREKQGDLRVLQAQINPHFLYNTLDSLNWMSMKYGAKDMQVMIKSLATMLRWSLNNGENIISVKSEIEQVKSYIEIQKIRFVDSFNVIYDLDNNIEGILIIKLILQPLVENAIIHGFEEGGVTGNLYISGHLDNDFLVFKVKNDGNKVDLHSINRILYPNKEEKPKSYGIKNVNDRLKKYYGEEFGLCYSIEDDLTVATIKIPV